MASLTVLRRRVARWRRYADRAVPLVPWGYRKTARGHSRAVSALVREMDRREMLGARYWPTDEEPSCNVHEPDVTCYCTRRDGCPFADDDPDRCYHGDYCDGSGPECEPDDGEDHDDRRPVETVDTRGLP